MYGARSQVQTAETQNSGSSLRLQPPRNSAKVQLANRQARTPRTASRLLVRGHICTLLIHTQLCSGHSSEFRCELLFFPSPLACPGHATHITDARVATNGGPPVGQAGSLGSCCGHPSPSWGLIEPYSSLWEKARTCARASCDCEALASEYSTV